MVIPMTNAKTKDFIVTGQGLADLTSRLVEIDAGAGTLYGAYLYEAGLYPAPDEPATADHAANILLAMLSAPCPSMARSATEMMGLLPFHSASVSQAGADGETHWGAIVPASQIPPYDGSLRTLADHIAHTIRTTNPESIAPEIAANLWLALDRYPGNPSACSWVSLPDGQIVAASFTHGQPPSARCTVLVRVPYLVLLEYSHIWFDPALTVDLALLAYREAETAAVRH